MIGVHRHAADLFRPMDRRIEGEYLAGGRDHEIVRLEKASHLVIPRGAHPERVRDFQRANLEASFDFPLQLGFHQRALGGIGIEAVELRSDLPSSNGAPAIPYRFQLMVGYYRFHRAAESLEYLKRAFA